MKDKTKQMLKVIESEAEYTAAYTGRKKFKPNVMLAMEQVQRDQFVPEHVRAFAFDNGPLSIGHGQTISQPYIVALMTDLLDLSEDSIVLEIGTGSGYQSAILSRIAKKIYSIERINELYLSATERLNKLGYKNIETLCENGYKGWSEKAPFDAIIVTAAASHIPEPLVQQLKPGGRMVIPVGLPYMHQELMLLEKDQNGATEVTSILAVSFVPLIDDDKETDILNNQ